jgi:uncharacterized membrane protein
MKIRSAKRTLVRNITIYAAILAATLIVVGPASAVVWNFTVPAAEVRPSGGVFVFPASTFADGRAKYFLYKHSPSEWIRFFILKSDDGVIRAAFDACDVCYRNRKGYTQNRNHMVCVNCGLKFRSNKINEVKGGCNPAPLRRVIKGGNLIISQRDLMSGLGFFK